MQKEKLEYEIRMVVSVRQVTALLPGVDKHLLLDNNKPWKIESDMVIFRTAVLQHSRRFLNVKYTKD